MQTPHGLQSGAKEFIPVIEKALPDNTEGMVSHIEEILTMKFPKAMRPEYVQNDLKSMLAATHAICQQEDYSKALLNLDVPCLLYVGEKDEYCQPMQDFALEAGIECVAIDGFTHADAYWDSKAVAPIILNFLENI